MRQQLTAFLEVSSAERVEVIRRQYDPVMCARIRSHFTVLYEVPDIDAAAERLLSARALRMQLTDVRRWPPPQDGLYLGVDDPYGDLGRLRSSLGIPPGHYQPHVTLMHPATTEGDARDLAWNDLRSISFSQAIEVADLTFIQSQSDRWREVRTVRLSGGS